ncbi:hypothetical protein D3C80_1100090 [compost metagenome]
MVHFLRDHHRGHRTASSLVANITEGLPIGLDEYEVTAVFRSQHPCQGGFARTRWPRQQHFPHACLAISGVETDIREELPEILFQGLEVWMAFEGQRLLHQPRVRALIGQASVKVLTVPQALLRQRPAQLLDTQVAQVVQLQHCALPADGVLDSQVAVQAATHQVHILILAQAHPESAGSILEHQTIPTLPPNRYRATPRHHQRRFDRLNIEVAERLLPAPLNQ